MASRFQSRLVGTIILVSIGVIILPDVFDGKKTHYQEDVASIPLKPDVGDSTETYEMLEPETDKADLPPAPVTEKQPKQDKSVQSSPEPQRDKAPVQANPQTQVVETQERNVPEANDYQDSAWIIQLMALKNADNAKKLVADLQKRGYQAHTKVENGFTRVIIGPDVSKSKLERQLTELEKITGAKGRLINFKPLNP
ncbi:SPOR domain-containing protein [Vibrio sp.]|nr:SPOR domain-containing protein [Vibrio sp.]